MYLSITGVENERISKFAPFDTQAEADAHAAEFSGFVYNNDTDHPIPLIRVDAGNAVTLDPIPTPAELDAQRLAAAQAAVEAQLAMERSLNIALADVLRRSLNGLFYLANEVRTINSQPPLTQAQFVNFLDGPDGDTPISQQELRNYIKGKLS